MKRPLHITVMLGGPSAEREVSLRSGAAVAAALRSLGHKVHEVDPRDESWALPRGTDVVFLALHGTYGEDGTVQRRLEELVLGKTFVRITTTIHREFEKYGRVLGRVTADGVDVNAAMLAEGFAAPN